MSAGFFRGTSVGQDARFGDKMSKLKKTMRFPECFKQKVDMSKVRLAVLKPGSAPRFSRSWGSRTRLLLRLFSTSLKKRRISTRASFRFRSQASSSARRQRSRKAFGRCL